MVKDGTAIISFKGVEIVFFFRSFALPLFLLEKLFLSFSNKIILISETLKMFYKRFNSKLVVILNPINYKRFKPNKIKRTAWREKTPSEKQSYLSFFLVD